MRKIIFVFIVFLICGLSYAQERKSTRNINEDIFFSLEFYSYTRGRILNGNGEGRSWYNRFGLIHVSDVHSAHGQLAEALQVADGKVELVVNTGDVAHGVSSSDASKVKEAHKAISRTVQKHSRLPYLQVPGNHDVTGLSKSDFFDKVSPLIERGGQKIVWGDKENSRAYGYMDFTDDSYNGDFRIIMLDPFDYEDGQFDNPYRFMAAVFSQKQVDWLISVLKDAAVKGYHVITMMHYSFGDSPIFNEQTANPDAFFYQDPFMIPEIIEALQKSGKLSRKYPDSAGIHNVEVDADFSTVPKLNFVAHLFGHIHSRNEYQCQKSDGTKYDILMLGETAIAVPGTALNKIDIVPGTLNDISFSALEIDIVEQTIYRISYGAYLNHDGSNSSRTEKISYRF